MRGIAGAGGDFGGGGGNPGPNPTPKFGNGGFGGGGGGGGGGGAAGGAVFVRSDNGATLTVADSSINGSAVAAGSPAPRRLVVVRCRPRREPRPERDCSLMEALFRSRWAKELPQSAI